MATRGEVLFEKKTSSGAVTSKRVVSDGWLGDSSEAAGGVASPAGGQDTALVYDAWRARCHASLEVGAVK